MALLGVGPADFKTSRHDVLATAQLAIQDNLAAMNTLMKSMERMHVWLGTAWEA